jgi:periplasmic divalent cation tolerance protein
MAAEDCLVLCSCPDAKTARELAGVLVEQRLAACVNILPGVTSVYAWEGRIETTEEQLLLIKTMAGHYLALEACIKQRHPYDVPEIIAVPIERGSADYLDWLRGWLGWPS